MIHLADEQIDRALEGADVVDVLGRAFAAFSRGEAAMQERIRTEAGPVKLSTMGGVWPAEGFAGAKVYTTIAGQFNFVIALFSAKTGEPLATLEANALTRWRTAAVSVLAAKHLAKPGASSTNSSGVAESVASGPQRPSAAMVCATSGAPRRAPVPRSTA